MHPAVERYVGEVLHAAALAKRDEREVREELLSHLDFMEEAIQTGTHSEEEVFQMLNQSFGNPEEIGKRIADAKGRFRTYLKKEARKLPASIAIAVVVALLLRWQVTEAFSAQNDSMEPVVQNHAWMLVNKLAYRMGAPRAGDIVVYDENGKNIVGMVQASTAPDGSLTVSKLKEGSMPARVRRDQLIGRVWLTTRR